MYPYNLPNEAETANDITYENTQVGRGRPNEPDRGNEPPRYPAGFRPEPGRPPEPVRPPMPGMPNPFRPEPGRPPEPFRPGNEQFGPNPNFPPQPGPRPNPYFPPQPGPMPNPEPPFNPQYGRGKPTSPPPQTIPRQAASPGLRAVDPFAIRECLYHYTYVWLNNGREFWMYPIFVGRRSVSGYQWTNFGWVYTGIDLRSIQSFYCVPW